MPELRQITALLELERAEEQMFTERLTAAERRETGTPQKPAPKDCFAHAIGGKQQMLRALVAARMGGEPDASHNADELHDANADRSFANLERDARDVADDLLAEIQRLDATTLGSAPGWISDATLADEIIQQCVTHALVHMSGALCARGDSDLALEIQLRFVAALPPDTGVLQRSRALYNLGCLYLLSGREDDAIRSITEATQLRPDLVEHARHDTDLEPILDRLP